MREGWEEKQLGEVSEIIMGQAPPGKDCNRENVGYPFVKTGQFGVKYPNINEWTINPLKKVDNRDVLITVVGATIGKLNLGVECAIGRSVAGIRPSENDLNQIYLYNYLSMWVERLREMSTGAAITVISKKMIYDIPIPIPPLPEQKQIVAILDQAFEAIDKAKENIEKNIENAKELLDSYKTALLEKYASGNFVEFESIVKLSRGHNPPKKDFIYEPKEGYVRFYQIRDGWSDKYKVYVPETTKLHRVQEDEMLMVAYRHIGKVFRGVNGAFNVALCKIANLNTEVLNNDYLFELIPSPFIKGELLKISERSLIPSMSVKELAKLKVPLPSIEKQLEIVKILTSLNSDIAGIINKYEVKLNSLEELKKSILQKAFAGELTQKEMAA